MAKQFNVDEAYDVIEVIFEGKVYKIEKISQELLNKISKSGEESKEGEEDAGVLAKQVGLILNEDPKTFKDSDVRKMGAVIKYFKDMITDDVKSKNVDGEEEKSTD